jgi:hypothetical protein
MELLLLTERYYTCIPDIKLPKITEKLKIAIMAGIDMSMVPEDYTFYNDLLDLVAKGEVLIQN